MKTLRYLLMTGITIVSLCGPRVVQSQTAPTPTPPTVVPHDGDLKGLPDNVKTLIVSFDLTRDKYLADQAVLLAKLKGATTPADQEKIREQLKDNRQAFLDILKNFRSTLKDDLVLLKGKISDDKLKQILDAAHDAAVEGGSRKHKGANP